MSASATCASGAWHSRNFLRTWDQQCATLKRPKLALAAAWYTAAADSPRVYVAFSGNGGRKFGAPIRVDEGKAIGRVGVAMLDDGTAAVSWMEGETKEARVRARFVREDARPGVAATVARLPGARASGVPQMVRDGDRLVFSWTEPGKPAKVKLAAVKLPKD